MNMDMKKMSKLVWIIRFGYVALYFILVTTSSVSGQKCRDRRGSLPQVHYNLWTCSQCYAFLFAPDGSPKELESYGLNLRSRNTTYNVFPIGTLLIPDITNSTNRDQVCSTLKTDECTRWTDCCMAAIRCCDRQRSMPPMPNTGKYCPRTWDGFGCWDDTKPGVYVTQPCPTFIEHAFPTANAQKICRKNGTWYTQPPQYFEWTDYTKCVSIDNYRVTIFIGIGVNAASVVVLIPAMVIFLVYRTLRSQHRIRIHIHLFASFVFSSIIYILWDVLVYRDRLISAVTESVMYKNTGGCKFLYFLTRYTRTTNYMWMFCEGFYLHRLIVNAFEPPKSLIWFYLVGWAFPAVPVTIYSVLRSVYANENCWVNHFGNHEWWIYAPNLLALLTNLFFLCNILRILLTQLQAHPNEPSSYRRALKATFILIPLFGLQLLFIIYRVPDHSPASYYFEIITAIITNSQGLFVAMIFCFFNGEVFSLLNRSCKRHCYTDAMREAKAKSVMSMSTQVQHSTDMNGRSTNSRPFKNGSGSTNQNYIALEPLQAKKDENGTVVNTYN
ncbi:unnamed protein product [Owenia fusiformis]|uniref:Uncharacterized protein n=1 Tax=Owenia fusiformis TaxID=6347 RepID=A0A8J1UKG4_OWEFU|nr:unnamed protein product [Owenia fusiformis]